MYKQIIHEILIDGKKVPLVTNVTIKSSRNSFTDTAEIYIPNRLSQRNKKISELIVKGSPVVIKLGYDPDLVVEFEGFVSNVIPDKLCVVKCEDQSYNLKRQSVGKDIIQKATTIKKVLDAVYTGKMEVFDAYIGDWSITKTSTVIDVLAELQDKFKVYSYFRSGVLVVGAQADKTENKTVTCHFQKNLPLNASGYSLRDPKQERIVVNAKSINRKGEINEIFTYYDGNPEKVVHDEVAPTSGVVNEFHIGGQSDFTIARLKTLAEIRLKALTFTGAEGSIVMFGVPSVKHGDIAKVIDLDVSEKDNKFSIVGVTKTFGKGVGYRQSIDLGISI